MTGDLYINGENTEGNCTNFTLSFKRIMYNDELNLDYKTVKEIKNICKKYLDEHFFNTKNDSSDYIIEDMLLLLAFLTNFKDEDLVEYY